MKTKGFTLVELLAVIVILAVILAIAIPGISGIIKSSIMSSMESDAKLLIKSINLKKLEDSSFDPESYNGHTEDLLTALRLSPANYEDISLINHNGELYIEVKGKGRWDGFSACGSYQKMRVSEGICEVDFIPPVITLNGADSIEVDKGTAFTDAGAIATDNIAGDVTSTITTTGTVDINTIGTYTITYTVTDSSGNTATITRTINVVAPNYAGPSYKASKGVNGPVLASGMVPIKWDGSTWIDTDIYDSAWYNYTTTDKQWANARTADGSMWVWIPRYAYQIASGYHTTTSGTINVKFLKNTSNTASDGSDVDTVPTYVGSSQTNYIIHPAFTFGITQLTGMWVAKFETSGTTSSLDFKPGVVSLKTVTVGNMFTASRNMETNSKYGWGLASGLNGDGTFTTDTNNVDTHMMKNTEWGSIGYLSLSTFGKNAEITINSNSSFYTGGGSGTVYITNVGQSTTGNVYGIYDISGGSYEYVMGNYNNTAGSSGLTPSSINDKYINRYTAYDSTKYGDALYETSTSTSGTTAWYTDATVMISSGSPWFMRSGYWSNGTSAGAFYFGGTTGGVGNSASWRSVVLVGTGL